MKKELAEAWVKDLRTTTAPQAQGKLFDGAGYCCLGRLCKVMGAEFEKTVLTEADFVDDAGEVYYPVRNERKFASSKYVPSLLVLEAGMKSASGAVYGGFGQNLSVMNDIGKSFSEIADVIEKHWNFI